MGLKLKQPPKLEPVALAEAKVDRELPDGETRFDNMLKALIVTSRCSAEAQLGRVFITQQWLLTLDCFPGGTPIVTGWGGPLFESGFEIPWTGVAQVTDGTRIELPFPPLQSVDDVSYVDETGVERSLTANDYQVTEAEEPALIVPAFGKEWPGTRRQLEAVKVLFTCGYGDKPTDVPEGIKRWMLLLIGAMFENRELLVVDKRITQIELPFADGLLDPYSFGGFITP